MHHPSPFLCEKKMYIYRKYVYLNWNVFENGCIYICMNVCMTDKRS